MIGKTCRFNPMRNLRIEQLYIKSRGGDKMAQRNRKTKTVEDRYKEYTKSTIKLSEDGIVYEVLLNIGRASCRERV